MTAKDHATILLGRTWSDPDEAIAFTVRAFEAAQEQARNQALLAAAAAISDEAGKTRTMEAYRAMLAAWKLVVALTRRS